MPDCTKNTSPFRCGATRGRGKKHTVLPSLVLVFVVDNVVMSDMILRKSFLFILSKLEGEMGEGGKATIQKSWPGRHSLLIYIVCIYSAAM